MIRIVWPLTVNSLTLNSGGGVSSLPMQTLTFKVYVGDREVMLKDYIVDPELVPFAAYRYRKFAEALGQGEVFKTGNFDAARAIFEDCVARWNDVYSLISLAQMYESGSGVPVTHSSSSAV